MSLRFRIQSAALIGAFLVYTFLPFLGMAQLSTPSEMTLLSDDIVYGSPYDSPGPNYTLICTFKGFHWAKTSNAAPEKESETRPSHCVLCYASSHGHKLFYSVANRSFSPALTVERLSDYTVKQPLILTVDQLIPTRGPPHHLLRA